MSFGAVKVFYQRSSSTFKFQDLEDKAPSSELVSMQLPDSGHTLHFSDKASLVGSSASGFHFFKSKIGRASSTDLMPSNLYIPQKNYSTFIFFFG